MLAGWTKAKAARQNGKMASLSAALDLHPTAEGEADQLRNARVRGRRAVTLRTPKSKGKFFTVV